VEESVEHKSRIAVLLEIVLVFGEYMGLVACLRRL